MKQYLLNILRAAVDLKDISRQVAQRFAIKEGGETRDVPSFSRSVETSTYSRTVKDLSGRIEISDGYRQSSTSGRTNWGPYLAVDGERVEIEKIDDDEKKRLQTKLDTAFRPLYAALEQATNAQKEGAAKREQAAREKEERTGQERTRKVRDVIESLP